MSKSKIAFAALAILLAVAAESRAADPMRCLSPQQRRTAVAENRALPLGQAVRPARHQFAGDIVRARLCDSDGTLVYQLTILSRNGKVTRATVNAMSGEILDGR